MQAEQQVPQAESESVSLQLCSLQARSARAWSPREQQAPCSLLSTQPPEQEEVLPLARSLPVRQREQPAWVPQAQQPPVLAREPQASAAQPPVLAPQEQQPGASEPP